MGSETASRRVTGGILAAVVLSEVFLFVHAQAPDSLAGRTIELTITTGSGWFTPSGKYRFLPSATDTFYVIASIHGCAEASMGTYRYTKASSSLAVLQLDDLTAGRLTLTCTFTRTNSGSYVLVPRQNPALGRQSGTFVIYAGSSPTSLAGSVARVGITSGESPFAEQGAFEFRAFGDGTYQMVPLSSTVTPGSGTYAYDKNSPFTGMIKFADFSGGSGQTIQLSFATAESGTLFLRKIGALAYQTGVFVLEAVDTTGPFIAVTSHTTGQNVGSSSITVRGTATDSGRGNSGISWVTVNDERAGHDTVAGAGTVNWSRTILLNPGPNTIIVVASDNSFKQNTTTLSFTLNFVMEDTLGPLVLVTSHTNHQTVTSSTITLSGTATDALRGNNGVAEVTVNGERANTDAVSGSGTAFWSKTIALAQGPNTLTVVARDNSPFRNTTMVRITLHYTPPATGSGSTDVVYVEDEIPKCAASVADGSWEWVDSNPAPISGRLALRANQGSGLRGRWFRGATTPLVINPGELLVAYVHINPSVIPKMIMIQWREGTSWEHRAYWGDDLFPNEWTKSQPTSKVRIGDLPLAGQWVRLEVPARLVALEGKEVHGISLNVYDGEVAWDHIGKTVPARDQIWIGDDVPDNAVTDAFWAAPWVWTNASPTPYSGTRTHVSTATNELQTQFVSIPAPGWQIDASDSMFTHVFLDPSAPPKMIMIQWWDGSWEHRAYWGEDSFPNAWTKGERASKVWMGHLPPAGQWVRLSVPATLVGLENRCVTGVAFTVHGGKVAWDNTGRAIPSIDFVWVGDCLPEGAVGQSYTGEDWTWSTSAPAPFSGDKAHVSPPAEGYSGHFFVSEKHGLQIDRGDVLMAYVYINPTNLPRMIMLQWNDGSTTNPWGHRAYWGENLFPYGSDGPPDRCYMGPVPPAGRWIRLEVPAKLVGLEGKLIRGMSFDRYGGHVLWDHAGKSSAKLQEDVLWLAEKLPPGAWTETFNEQGWTWATGFPVPVVGELTHKSPISTQTMAPQQFHQHLFLTPVGQGVNTGEKLFAYVYLDSTNPPQMVMLQWNDGSWDHRAYWGENRFNWGRDRPPDRYCAGPLPPTGQWVRLEVPASAVGLENRQVYGMAFSLYGGQAWWGHAGKLQAPRRCQFRADDWVWVDDDIPVGAVKMATEGDGWVWTSDDPGPVSGTFCHTSRWAQPDTLRSHYFAYCSDQPVQPMTVNPGDELFCYAYLDEHTPPRMIMLQWRVGSSWEQRAYWGENLFPYGTGTPTSKVHMGMLPPAGKWVRLSVPASAVGLAGRIVNGMAFTAAGGRVWWDRAGKCVGFSGAGLLKSPASVGSGEIVNNLGFVEDRASAYADSPLTCSVFVNDVFYGLIRGLAGHVYRIEASTDFSDWVPIATGIASERGRLWFKDSEASGYTMRFYRAKPTGE